MSLIAFYFEMFVNNIMKFPNVLNGLATIMSKYTAVFACVFTCFIRLFHE